MTTNQKYCDHIHVLGHGWLGAPLALALDQMGYKVTSSNRSGVPSPLIKATDVSHKKIDISQDDTDFSIVKTCDYLIVCITGKDVSMFQRLADTVRASNIKGVIYTSSTSVYGSSDAPISEQSKRLIETHPLLAIEHCLSQFQNTQTTILRLSGLVGGTRHPGNFFKSKSIPDPSYPINLVHQEDCINIICRVVEDNRWGEIFNVCASTHPSKQAFYQQATRQLSLPSPKLGGDSGRPKKVISNDKVKQQLDYQFIHDDLMTVDWSC